MGGTSSPVSVAQELGLSLTATITMNDAAVRNLAGVGGSGTTWSMSSLYGKSSVTYFINLTTAGFGGVVSNYLAIGPSNNFYTSGASGNGPDSYVTIFGANTGAQTLSKIIGGSGTSYNAASVDASGNIASANSAPTSNFCFIYYANSAYTVQWGYALRYVGNNINFGECKISGSNVYVAGFSNGSAALTGKFIGKLNSGGLVWLNRVGPSVEGIRTRFALDASENIYTLINYFDFAKLNSSGVIQWQNTYTPYLLYGSPALDSSQTHVYGSFFDASNAVSFVVMKLNASSGGNPVWSRGLTLPAGESKNNTNSSYYDTAVDSSGNVYSTFSAYNSSSIYFVYLTKYNSSGVIQWQRKITPTVSGSGTFVEPRGLAITSTGEISVLLGLGSPVRQMLLKLPNDGSKTGTYTVGTVDVAYAAGSLTDSARTVTAGGSSSTSTNFGFESVSSAASPFNSSLTTLVTTI
jgi:hypothetical protein